MSSQPQPENRARLARLADALAERVPALHLEYRLGPDLLGDRGNSFEWMGLKATTSLIPAGTAQVVAFLDYRTGNGVPTYELGIYEGHPPVPVLYRHLVDPETVIDLIADWATGPLRTGAGKRRPPSELEEQARQRVAMAIRDSLAPPRIKDLAELPAADSRRMAFYFPRDQLGRMRSGVRVLLEVLAPPARAGARAPCRFVRLGKEGFRGAVADEFVENQDYRWQTQPWRWRQVEISPSERWGTDDLDRARASVRHLVAGDWHEAMGLWGVNLGPTLGKILDAQPLGHLYRDLAAGWATVAAEQLARCAPWRLSPLATKKSIRLFGLGGMNIQMKPGVNLQLRDGHPTIDFESSASNRRLAREDWERPLDFEACWLKIAAVAGLPIDWPTLES